MPNLSEVCPSCPLNKHIEFHKSIFCDIAGGLGDKDPEVKILDFDPSVTVDQLSSDMNELTAPRPIRDDILLGVDVENQLRMCDAVSVLDSELANLALRFCETRAKSNTDECRINLSASAPMSEYLRQYRINVMGSDE